MQVDDHLNRLTAYVLNGWLSTRNDIKEEAQPNWLFHEDMAVLDGMLMK